MLSFENVRTLTIEVYMVVYRIALFLETRTRRTELCFYSYPASGVWRECSLTSKTQLHTGCVYMESKLDLQHMCMQHRGGYQVRIIARQQRGHAQATQWREGPSDKELSDFNALHIIERTVFNPLFMRLQRQPNAF